MPFSSALAYPSDDGTVYQVVSDQPTFQAALGDLVASAGTEPIYPALARPRYTRWTASVSGVPVSVKVMCSPVDPNYLTGPGVTQNVGGITFTLRSCVGERRS